MKMIFIQTGGTIDKDYPHTTKGYAFEFGDEPATKRLLERIIPNPSFTYDIITVCQKDSLEMNGKDRDDIWECIMKQRQQQQKSKNINTSTTTITDNDDENDDDVAFIITHGTDTLIETAQYLSMKIKQQQQQREQVFHQRTKSPIIVLTGAMCPERFTNSDAPINWGIAIGAAQMLLLLQQQQKQKLQPTNNIGEGVAVADVDDVYIAMHGIVKPSKNIQRNMDTGKFY